MDEVREARAFAIGAHIAAGTHYGGQPYETHLRAVVETLHEYGYRDRQDSVVIAAAWLHDVVEDTEVTLGDVTDMFCSDVADLVGAVTDGPGETRAARKAHMYQRLSAQPHALPIKLADRIANVRACLKYGNPTLLRMYQREDEAFQRALRGVSTDLRVRVMWDDYDALIHAAEDPRSGGTTNTTPESKP